VPPDEKPREPDGGDEQGPLDRWILPFFTDPSLWPVTVVAGAIFMTLGTTAVLFAVVERNRFALGALAILLLMSVDAVVRDARRGRFGVVSRCVAGLWGLVCLAALATRRTGLF
jgi:hypothetical protein